MPGCYGYLVNPLSAMAVRYQWKLHEKILHFHIDSVLHTWKEASNSRVSMFETPLVASDLDVQKVV